MKNKLRALLAAVSLSISLLHMEAYAGTNPHSAKPSEVSENVKLQNETNSEELEVRDSYAFLSGTRTRPTSPDENDWDN